MDDPEPQSLFIVVDYDFNAPHLGSIIQLEINVNNHGYTLQSTSTPKGCPQIKRTSSHTSIDTQLNEKEYLAHFSQQGYPPKRWLFCQPGSCKEDLYMFPDRGVVDEETDVPLNGSVFSLRTKMCQQIKAAPPKVLRCLGPVVTVREHIYFMTHPYYYYGIASKPYFECYNPVNDSWEALEPFPICELGRSEGFIVAIAVWDDTILFNINYNNIWAYNVDENKWYPVTVVDSQCFLFSGRAIVVGNTIYALTNQYSETVLVLSVEKKQIGGDLIFKCSLCSKINVLGMKRLIYPNAVESIMRRRHLVHMGKDKFCLVQSAMFCGLHDYQPIQVSTIKLDGEKSIVIDTCFYNFKLVDHEQFEVVFCFSLPQDKTTAFEKGKGFVFDLNPFPEDFVFQEDETFQGYEIVNLPKDDPPFNVHATFELVRKSNIASTISAVTGHPSLKSDSEELDKSFAEHVLNCPQSEESQYRDHPYGNGLVITVAEWEKLVQERHDQENCEIIQSMFEDFRDGCIVKLEERIRELDSLCDRVSVCGESVNMLKVKASRS